MARERAPAGGVTIGPTFYPGGTFLPDNRPPARERAPSGGLVIGGKTYPPGSFLPANWRELHAHPGPAIDLEIEPGARVIDSLVQIGPPESGDIRTVRVHVDSGMTAADVIAEIEATVASWNAKYQGGAATRLVDFWRQR